ncbi:MAG TPA: glycosyl hydrolase [Planctomycetota bacterium]|nr:glycosyl hydrolase [Planctomycetota bacterium]
MESRTRKRASARPALLLGTAKGGFILAEANGAWRLSAPMQFGSKVNDFRLDPRDGRTLLLASNGGHLGPTLYRSVDRGRTWTEATQPPKFAPASRAKRFAGTSRGRAVKTNFWLEPAAPSNPGAWYCGTTPPALFRSDDAGATWRGVDGWNENPSWATWTSGGDSGTPDGSMLHSIVVDPRDPAHLFVGVSSGGVFESRDAGASWAPLNRGVAADFLPPGDHAFGHDPHHVVAHPADPDRLYQQNHCGFYRLDRKKGDAWKRVGRNLPKEIGDVGFGVAVHPTDRDVAWMFPMDGTRLWPRTSPGGRPCVFRTDDGGRTWKRLDRGLPKRDAWFTVMRQALCADDVAEATGVYFGTTSGEVWGSFDRGASWRSLAAHLPRIYSVRVARFR